MAIAERTPAPLPGKIARLLRESKWLLIILAAVYVALVLLTFDRADPGWSHSAAGRPSCTTPADASARGSPTCCSIVFGLSAYWLVALCLYAVAWGYRRLDGSSHLRPPSVHRRAGGLLHPALRVQRARGAALPFAQGEPAARARRHAGRGARPASSARRSASPARTLVLLTFFADRRVAVHRHVVADHHGAHRRAAWSGPGPPCAAASSSAATSKAGAIAAEAREAVVEEDRKRIIEDHEPIRIEPPVREIPKSERVHQGKAGAAVRGPARLAAAAARAARRAGARTPSR